MFLSSVSGRFFLLGDSAGGVGDGGGTSGGDDCCGDSAADRRGEHWGRDCNGSGGEDSDEDGGAGEGRDGNV